MLLVVVIVGIVALERSQQRPVQAAQTTSARGALQISSSVQLDVTVTPDVAQPGDRVELQISLINQSQRTQMPAVSIRLPAGLALDVLTLPGGMTMNVAARTLNWLPVVVASGGEQQVTLPLRVETADIPDPEQEVVATMQLDETEATAAALIWMGVPPQVDEILAPQQVAVGQPFQLRVETSGSGPFTNVWHLGDGRRVPVNQPTVVYSAVGQYRIEAETSNPLATVTRSRQITVVPHPAAQFEASDFTPTTSQPVNFVNQSGGQPPLTYAWEFGDGTTSTEKDPAHHYDEPGTYQVRLQVSNEYGESEATWSVTVGLPPTADVTLPERVTAGQPLVAEAVGDESVTELTWDMGDGRSYQGAQVNHTYRQSGEYYVTLTASNPYGATTVGRRVRVERGLLRFFLPFIVKSNQSSGGVVAVGERPLNTGVDDLVLPDVAIDEPFVMEPLDLPAGLSQTEQLFVYINEARAQFGRSSLNLVPELTAAAQQHVNDMAEFAYTGHLGSDGSTPAERLLWLRYPGGYAGEATAWGFEHPYQAVEFWVNSPPHRRIILNEFATDVGVGYTVDYSAPNVWYWTAEFGQASGVPIVPTLRVRAPQAGVEPLNTEPVTYAWNWPAPLADGQQFVVTLSIDGEDVELGAVAQPRLDTYFVLETETLAVTEAVGVAEWQVSLQDGSQVLAATQPQPITIVPDPTLPTPTPVLTPTVAAPTPTATATPTATEPPRSTRPPAPTLPPPLITATPNP